MIALSIALAIWAGALAFSVRCWASVRKSEMELARTLSNNNRATAERLERATNRFYEQLRAGGIVADNIAPVGEPARPHFGTKIHVAVDNDKPDGAA